MLAAGLVIFLAGIARDLQWHATHDTQREFETAAKQVEVHWLLWVGVTLVLVACWMALTRSPANGARRGYLLTAASGTVYTVVSVWHFIEHANGADPQVAHAFLYAASVGLVWGASLALIASGRARTAHREA
jgi:FtsH-binding integral membrane protein